jgi:hypothetical protein
MTTWEIITYGLSTLIWMCPPFKNRGTAYRNYFILMAIYDPVALFARYILGVPYMAVRLMFSFLLVASLLKNKN